MLVLNIEANTIQELKEKALIALGLPIEHTPPLYAISAPIQTAFPATDLSNSLPIGNTPPKKNTRRTKAEIEAERQAKNAGASSAEIIQNNFEAGDAHEEAIIEEALLTTPIKEAPKAADKGKYDPEAKISTYPDLVTENKALLKQVIDKRGMDSAIGIVGNFGEKLVINLRVRDLPAFKKACEFEMEMGANV